MSYFQLTSLWHGAEDQCVGQLAQPSRHPGLGRAGGHHGRLDAEDQS